MDNLSKKINGNLKNDNWDSQIASNIFKIRKKRKKIIYSISSSMAAAALVFIIFTINLNNTATPYDSFITQQTSETYRIVFENTSSDFDTDDLITEAMDIR